ncbi:hypothetical protein DNTS_022097, partial [Danionella cerebrum]
GPVYMQSIFTMSPNYIEMQVHISLESAAHQGFPTAIIHCINQPTANKLLITYCPECSQEDMLEVPDASCEEFILLWPKVTQLTFPESRLLALSLLTWDSAMSARSSASSSSCCTFLNFDRLPLVSLDLQLKFVNQILQSGEKDTSEHTHPGLEFLELFLSTLHGQILSLIQTVLQILHSDLKILLHPLKHFWLPELYHQLHFGPEQGQPQASSWCSRDLCSYLRVQKPDTLTGIHQLLLSHFTSSLCLFQSSSQLFNLRQHQGVSALHHGHLLLHVILASHGIIKLCLNVPELFLGLSSLAIGMAQLNLHLIKISLHLLLDSQGIISAPDLRVQSALHGFNDSLAVPLDLLHLLILLCKLPVDLTLNLVELKLDSKNLGLLMLQVPLCAGWHQFHIWSSTEQLHCWPLTFLSGAQPLPPALPQTAPGAGRSRDGLTAQRGPSCSLSTEIVYLAQVLIILGLKFTKLVLKERITRRKADLCFGYSLHVAGKIIDLHLVFTLLFLKLLLDTLQVVDLLSQLSHTVGLLLAQSCSGSFMLESGLFKITAQLLEFSFTLLVHLNLSSSGSTGLLKPLTDLLKFPGEISSLLLNFSTSCTLSLNLFLQFLNASLELGIHSLLLSSTFIQECLMNQNGKYLKFLDLLLELSTQRLFIFNLAEQLACFKVFPGVDFIFLSLEIIQSLLGELQIINVFLQLRALILQFPLLSCELSIDFFLILQSLSCLFELSLELDFALDQTLTPLLSI